MVRNPQDQNQSLSDTNDPTALTIWQIFAGNPSNSLERLGLHEGGGAETASTPSLSSNALYRKAVQSVPILRL
jgi:hypothetical protein